MSAKILLPYLQISKDKYIRQSLLDSKYLHYVFVYYGNRSPTTYWGILSTCLNICSQLADGANHLIFTNHKDAMKCLDRFLIDAGYKLINNEEDVDKYRMLI